MKSIYFLLTAAGIFFLIACSSSKSASSGSTATKTASPDQMENLNPAVDLADHLRRIPGLSVTGSGPGARISIRGLASFSADVEPLFVVNGMPLTGGLSDASSMVNVADINTVRVLKTPNETNIYGIRGSNGVIEINLKK